MGRYWFQARWTADASRASNATYTVTGKDGVTKKTVDQRGSSNTWMYLGVKMINAASTATIKISPSSTGTLSVDAVRALQSVVSTSVHYVYTDHLNTPRVITRATDNKMVWRWDNADPFGVAQPNQNPNALGTFTYNPRFPGQLYDAETGLHYNYHRHYDPKTGRYTQSDPIGLAGGVNTYGYVGGNPVGLSDPTGESAITNGIKLGGRIGGSFGPYGAAAGAIIGGVGGAVIGDAVSNSCKDGSPCPPCNPVVGTVRYRIDMVPPSKPHYPHTGSHVHLYEMHQSPSPMCKCFWHPTGTTELPPPPGISPM